MKSKMILCYTLSMMMIATSCKKSRTPKNETTVGNFWHGNVLGSPVTFIGPGNAILLRSNGTMREYANDYFSAGTTMTAGDTASAKIKLEGTYTTSTSGSTTTVIATWVNALGSPVLTYTLTGVIAGNTMSGTFNDQGTGIGTEAHFSFTDP